MAPEKAIKRLSSHLSVGRVLTIDRLNKRNQSVSQPLADWISSIERWPRGQVRTSQRFPSAVSGRRRQTNDKVGFLFYFESWILFASIFYLLCFCQCENSVLQLTQAEFFFKKIEINLIKFHQVVVSGAVIELLSLASSGRVCETSSTASKSVRKRQKWQPCTASYDTYRPSQTSTKGRKNERKEIQSDVKVKTIDLRKSRSSRNVRLLSIGCSPSRTAIKYMSFINGDFINNKRIHLLLVSDFQLFNNLTTCEQTCQMWWANIHVLI